VAVVREPAPRSTGAAAELDAVLDAGLARLVDAVGRPGATEASAGVVVLLARAAAARGGRGLRTATRTAAAALERSPGPGAAPAPGIDGACGRVWALVEAARAIDDKALGWRALALATADPGPGTDPGGAANAVGLGLTHLRLWLAYRDPRSSARVRECVDAVLRDDVVDPAAGALLLAAGRVLGVRAALRAADAMATALHDDRPQDPGTAPGPAAAAFLVRHFAATGSVRSRGPAERAALAGGADPGTGHLLLDLAGALDHLDPDAARRHRALAGRTVARLRRRGDPDALALRLRLRHGGPRPWTVDGPAAHGFAAAC
jgi:hypothetical protein